MWSAIVGAWSLFRTIRRFRKEVEANAEQTLSEDNAKRIRMQLESFCVALEQGRTKDLPGWLHWACKLSKVDELFGTFGQHVLKSEKMKQMDPVLYRPH